MVLTMADVHRSLEPMGINEHHASMIPPIACGYQWIPQKHHPMFFIGAAQESKNG
jgi:hypothetical protein